MRYITASRYGIQCPVVPFGLRPLLVSLLFATAAFAQTSANSWYSFSGEIRTRMEAPTALSFNEGVDDAYLLSRLRLKLMVIPTPWLRFAAEAQDSRGFAYDAPAPGTVTNRVDLRQAWVQVGGAEYGMSLRAGRQSMRYGKGRLIADPDWGNTGQVFDAMRLDLGGADHSLSLFGASVVAAQDRAFDSTNLQNMLYGAYGGLNLASGRVRVEPYLLLKSNARVKSELGVTGALDVYTTGFRTAGKISASAEWETEMALQGGRLAGTDVQAFGGLWSAGWGNAAGLMPRFTGTYMYASGDDNPRDGVKHTFDTLYPSTHLRNGASDRLGWANVHDLAATAEWKAGKRCRLTAGAHDFYLATVNDALYSKSGSALVRNTKATSSHIGYELFLLADVKVNARLSAGAGYAHLFRGQFLRESLRASAAQPYVFLAYRFGTDPEAPAGPRK